MLSEQWPVRGIHVDETLRSGSSRCFTSGIPIAQTMRKRQLNCDDQIRSGLHLRPMEAEWLSPTATMLACSLSRENSVSCDADAAANHELVGESGPKCGNGPAVFIDFEELAVSEIGRSDIVTTGGIRGGSATKGRSPRLNCWPSNSRATLDRIM